MGKQFIRSLVIGVLLIVGLAFPVSADSHDVASDGQRLEDQSADVQATYFAVYGDRAAEQWARDHDREIQAPAPPAEPETAPAGEQIDWWVVEVPAGDVTFSLPVALLEVPADYRDPEAGSIRLVLAVRRATSPDTRIGYLLFNPGGPGASGADILLDPDLSAFSEEIVARFDIIGFDPRGVGASQPEFACGDPGEQSGLLEAINGIADTRAEIAVGEVAAKLCIQSMGPVGGRLHSEYVARDMDEIRKALGADQISYLGFSYGSTLGVWYATLFPESVRAMVVDGADNPVDFDSTATQQERIAEQLQQVLTLEAFLGQALAACDSPECPIYNDGDPVGYFKQAAAKLDLVNVAGNHPETGFYAVISVLYNEASRPLWWQGLYDLNENDDPAILLQLGSPYQLGQPGGANFTGHVNCLDGWVLRPWFDRATQLDDFAALEALGEEIAPLLSLVEGLHPTCPFYDQFAPEPLEGPLDGGGVPILVVGNRSDPATSFDESEELVTKTLSNGYLLETDYPAHIVYPNNTCVNNHVHRVLIDGVFPSEQRVLCEREG